MGMFIKEMVSPVTLNILTSNADPMMIRDESVARAVKELVKTIKSLELYPSLQSLIDRFEPIQKNRPTIYAHRVFYVWQMMQAGYQLMSLDLSKSDFLQSNSLKCQAAFLNILFDDICDLGRDKALFNKCVLALQGQIDQDEGELCQLISDTWSTFQSTIVQTPNYVLLKPFLEEAYQHWIGSFEYSLAIQRESFRIEEKWERHLELISPSTFIHMAGLIDLLFVPNFPTHQTASAIKVFLQAQKMGQLGNWASTWERELAQEDFTGGVYRIALENGWIAWDDLKRGSPEKIREQIRNSPVETYLWDEWKRLRAESYQTRQEIQLSALNGYVESFSAIMFMLVGSTGLV